MKDILNYFTIGEAYEKNEFNLESIKSTFNNGLEYEVYMFDKSISKVFFGSDIVEIYLYYNADVLSMIQVIFKENADFLLLLEMFKSIDIRFSVKQRSIYIIKNEKV